MEDPSRSDKDPSRSDKDPSRSDKDPRYYVVLDFEATCLKDGRPQPQEIIEFPSIIIDTHSRQIISEFQRYIKPVHHPLLTDFCLELTGITQEQVNAGTSFASAVKDYQKWLAENGLVGDNFIIFTCGQWDLQTMYPAQCRLNRPNIKVTHPFKRWINIKLPFSKLYKVKRSGGMVKMMDYVGLTLQGRHHSGIDDCRNTGRLLLQMMEDGFEYNEKLVTHLRK